MHGMDQNPFSAFSHTQQNTTEQTLKTQIKNIVAEKLDEYFYLTIDNLKKISVWTKGNRVLFNFQLSKKYPNVSIGGLQLKVNAKKHIIKQVLAVCANHKKDPIYIDLEDVNSETISFTPVFAAPKDEIADSADESSDDEDNYIKNPIKAFAYKNN
jgi:hypothetical protein